MCSCTPYSFALTDYKKFLIALVGTTKQILNLKLNALLTGVKRFSRDGNTVFTSLYNSNALAEGQRQKSTGAHGP